jgi:hypothetical protein
MTLSCHKAFNSCCRHVAVPEHGAAEPPDGVHDRQAHHPAGHLQGFGTHQRIRGPSRRRGKSPQRNDDIQKLHRRLEFVQIEFDCELKLLIFDFSYECVYIGEHS